MPNIPRLLDQACTFRARYARPPSFNLFTTLLNINDEVRLHSRFVAALLDPRAHALETLPLRFFLQQHQLESFALEGVRIECERFGIDILITNNRGQAIAIENKIHAGDQPQQLERYYTQLQRFNYHTIHMCYLTLDGRAPGLDSLGVLAERLADRGGTEHSLGDTSTLRYLSYATHMTALLDSVLAEATREPSLHDSIIQYRQVIDRLTGHDMNKIHRQTLAATLLEGDNLLAAHDIQEAYGEALITLQIALWRDIEDTVKTRHPELSHELSQDFQSPEELPDRCRSFIENARSNRYYGLDYTIPGTNNAYASIEIERALYIGIWCDKSETPRIYDSLEKRLGELGSHYSRNHSWVCFSCYPEHLDLRSPDAETLKLLTDTTRRQHYIDQMVDELARLWKMAQGL